MGQNGTSPNGTRNKGPRCVALVGPFQSGKTTLLEAILARTGAVQRQGTVEAGTTVGDASKEARDHKMSVEATFATTNFMGDGYTFVDCPPSLGLLTVNALTAAQGVLIPVQCEYLALEGLSQLMNTIQLVRKGLNPGLVVRGVVMTMYDSRMRLAQQVVNEVQSHFGEQVFSTLVPRSVRLGEAPSYGEPILSYAPTSSGGVAYAQLADELQKLNLTLEGTIRERTREVVEKNIARSEFYQEFCLCARVGEKK